MSLRRNLIALDDVYWHNDKVSIKPLKTMNDLIYAGYECRLTEEQQDMVSPFWFTIGRAYLFTEQNYPCIIYNEQSTAIGFINFCEWIGTKGFSWSFYIDKDHQGKGYGKSAAALAVDVLKRIDPDMPIKLSTEQSNIKAQKLYTSLGFEQSKELDGDDLVYVL